MNKQLFLLFYSEDEKNDTNAKLVMTYVNRFIIDEYAECEVIEVNRVPELKYSEFGVIQKLKFLYSIVFNFQGKYHFYNSFKQAAERSMLIQDDEFRTHFVIGMPNQFGITIICILCTSAQFHCTFLRSVRKDLIKEIRLNRRQNTIGDDIDTFIDGFTDGDSSQMTFWQAVRYIVLNVAPKKRMHSYKLLNSSESAKVCHRDSDNITFREDMTPDIKSFTESDNIYMRLQCERQSSKPLQFLTIPIIFIYLSQFIVLPSFYYKTLSHLLLLLSDNKYFPIFFVFLYLPLVTLPAIYCNNTYKMLDFFLNMAMLTKLLLFTKRYVNLILLSAIIVSYILFIFYEIYMFLHFCSIFYSHIFLHLSAYHYLHISVLFETFVGPEVFISVIPFCMGFLILSMILT